MGKGRLEAFSDGVIAVIITIMVLELKVPHGANFADLAPLLPVFLTYVLSFIYTAIYWNNHHHMFLAVKEVNGTILWANSHLLFWLSIVPFTTAWASENHFAPIPTAFYGVVLFLAAIAFTILQRTIVRKQGPQSILAMAIGTDIKGKMSPALYLAGILFAFARYPGISVGFYIAVAILWLIPDRRIERVLPEKHETDARELALSPAADEEPENEEELASVTPVGSTTVMRDNSEMNL